MTNNNITFDRDCLKAVAPFMSGEEIRYYLRGVLFTGKLLVATDGHREAVIKPSAFVGNVTDDFILPRELVAKLLKVKPEIKRAAILIKLDFSAKLAIVLHSINDNETILAQFPLEFVDGQFPDWRRPIPSADNYTNPAPASFNTFLLGGFESFGINATFFPNNEARGPMIVRAMTDKFEAFGLLMPMRGDEKIDIARPDWLTVEPVA